MNPDVVRARLPEFGQALAPEAMAPWVALYGFDAPLARCEHWRAGRLGWAQGELVAYLFEPPNPRGTALVVHGYYDHVGLFRHPILRLLEQGYAVAALDLPGHGLSSGTRASIQDFQHYTEALDALVEALPKHLPQNRVAVGQSTGAAVLMAHLFQHPAPAFSRACLIAPLVRPQQWWKNRLKYELGRLFLTEVARDYAENSHDETFLRFVREGDPLQCGSLPVAWVGAMVGWVKRFRRAPCVNMPVQVIQGDEDTTVDWRFNLPAIQHKFPQSEQVWIPGGRHHLVNESEALRTQVFDAMCEFLAGNAPAKKTD